MFIYFILVIFTLQSMRLKQVVYFICISSYFFNEMANRMFNRIIGQSIIGVLGLVIALVGCKREEDLTVEPNITIMRNVVKLDKTEQEINSFKDLLSTLSDDSFAIVREAVAQNLLTDSVVLAKLAKDTVPEIRLSVVLNPATPKTIIESLINDTDDYTRRIAQRYLQQGYLDFIYNQDQGNNSIKESVISNYYSLQRITEQLMDGMDLKLACYMFVTNMHFSDDVIQSNIHNKDFIIRMALAKSPHTPIKYLKKLSRDYDSRVREAIAYNIATPTRILEQIALDEVDIVKYYVATNSNTNMQTLNKLANDSSILVRSGVAENINTPVETLRVLSEYPHRVDFFSKDWDTTDGVKIAHKVAANPNTPKDIRDEYAKSRSVNIRGGLAINPNTDISLLKKLALDEFSHVRKNVAKNQFGSPYECNTLY